MSQEIDHAKEKNEIYFHALSVGVVLQTHLIKHVSDQRLILVEDVDHKLGIPAGKIKIENNLPIETPLQTISREVEEETGMRLYDHYHIVSTDGIVFIPSPEGLKMGILYYGEENPYGGEYPRAILKPCVKEKTIVSVHELSIIETINLIVNNQNLIRKPEFNIEAISSWIRYRIYTYPHLFQDNGKEKPEEIIKRLGIPNKTWVDFKP